MKSRRCNRLLRCACVGIVALVSLAALTAAAPMAVARNDAEAPPTPPTPPTLPDANAAMEAARALHAQLDALSREPASAERDAKAAYRRLAYDLLFHGLTAPPTQQAMVVAGLRLHESSAAVDALLSARQPSGAVDLEAARQIAAFTRGAAAGLTPLPPPDHPERSLQPLLAPLLQAAWMLEGRAQPPGPSWPAKEALTTVADATTRSDGSTAARDDARDARGAHDAPSDATSDASARAVDAAAAVRDWDASTLRPDLRAAALEVQAAAAHAATEQLQQEALEDLRRIDAVARWVDAVGAIRTPSRQPFDAVTRHWVTALREPARRADARQNMDRFAQQLAQVQSLPIERDLRAGQAAALEATAGRSRELLVEVERRRSGWAAAWATGKRQGDAIDRALRASRLLQVLAASVQLQRDEPAEQRLGGWGGFLSPQGALGIHPRALAARSALAIEALLEGRDSEVETQLQTLERELPVARFIARLSEQLGRWLTDRGGVAVQLQNAASGPEEHSWLGAQRAALMLYARYTREEAYARASRDEALAKTIRAYLAEVARGIDLR